MNLHNNTNFEKYDLDGELILSHPRSRSKECSKALHWTCNDSRCDCPCHKKEVIR